MDFTDELYSNGAESHRDHAPPVSPLGGRGKPKQNYPHVAGINR